MSLPYLLIWQTYSRKQASAPSGGQVAPKPYRGQTSTYKIPKHTCSMKFTKSVYERKFQINIGLVGPSSEVSNLVFILPFPVAGWSFCFDFFSVLPPFSLFLFLSRSFVPAWNYLFNSLNQTDRKPGLEKPQSGSVLACPTSQPLTTCLRLWEVPEFPELRPEPW